MFVSVIISNNIIDQTFEYYLPNEFEAIAQIGSRVMVNFGQSNRLVMGFIVDIYEEKIYDGSSKDIIDVLDYEPLITKEQFKTAEYIAKETVCPLARVLNLMIPKFLKLKTIKYLVVNDYCELDANLAFVFKGKSVIKITKEIEQYNNQILKEIKKGNAYISYEAKPFGKIKTITKYLVNQNALYTSLTLLKNPLHQDLLKRMNEDEALTKNEIIDKYEISDYLFNKILRLGFLEPLEVQISRIISRDVITTSKGYGSHHQTESNLTIIKDSTKNKRPVLWRPDTDDELNDTIVSLIKNNVNKDLNTMVIVPDILSSYKITTMIRRSLHLHVACLNSKLSDGEYLDYYYEIINNKYTVIVTTPKAALLPLINVGSIIMMDVEHDNYFNDQSPRYDLKKVMIYRKEIINCDLIFESFTPNLAEYSQGLLGKYQIINNYSNKKEIPTEVIDLNQELREGNNSAISNSLLKGIKINMFLHQVSLIITNNKNYSSLIMCRSCGTILKCPKCQISLKYHQKNQLFLCPVCSYRIPSTDTCPNCGEKSLRFEGVGMEQIKEELEEKVSGIKVILIDQPELEDFNQKMMQIEDGEVDVVIATDTYARSIQSKLINLVAYQNIDYLAGTQRYDAIQKAYNALVYGYKYIENKVNKDLLENEENPKRAKMYIQTYKSDSYFIQDFITNDYDDYLKNEIANRKALRNEPFYQVNRILVKAPYEQMFVDANSIKKMLQDILGKEIYIVGPNYNKTEQAASLIVKHQKENISDVYRVIYLRYQNSSTTIIIDKYPKYL